MNKKIANTLLLLTFLMGYLEWGTNQKVFIFEAEAELFQKALVDPVSLIHPFIIIPFAGQTLLIFTLFQKKPGRILSLIALCCLGSLMLFLTFIGIVSFNLKILGSTIPFIATGVFVLRNNKKRSAVSR